MPLVTECLRSTPTDKLFFFAGTQPTELRRQKAWLSLLGSGQEPKHLLHETLVSLVFGHLRQLKLRRPFVPAALEVQKKSHSVGSSVAGKHFPTPFIYLVNRQYCIASSTIN